MYFGFETMWTFTFIPAAFTLVMAVGIALAFVYAVGASRGKAAAVMYTRACVAVLGAGLAAIGVYAIASDQLERFVGAFGYAPLVEMGLLAVMFIGSMMLMATSYVNSKNA